MDVERVFYQYGSVMLRHAQLLVGSVSLAEDAVQEALVRVIRLHPVLRDEQHERAWLLAVTGNICRDMLRRRKRETALPEFFDAPDPTEGPDETVGQRDADRRLMQAVLELPVKYREAVLMTYYHELTGNQAAEAMGISPATFRSRLMRARNLLKVKLGEEADL